MSDAIDLDARYCGTLYNGHVECERAELCAQIKQQEARLVRSEQALAALEAIHRGHVEGTLCEQIEKQLAASHHQVAALEAQQKQMVSLLLQTWSRATGTQEVPEGGVDFDTIPELVAALEARIAELTKPVTNEEWEPCADAQYKRKLGRDNFDALLRRRRDG